MATNLYNPNTGAKLKAGETVISKETGKKVTQGTQYTGANAGGASNTTNLYNPNTGTMLGAGETVKNLQTGQNVTQGTKFIGATDLNKPVPNIPVMPTPDLGLSNQGLNQAQGTYLSYNNPDGTLKVNPLEVNANNEANNINNLITQLTEAQNAKPSEASLYAKAQKETGILAKQQAVSDLSGQLGGITAQGQTNQLSVVGQGRGIPEAIIGGQQAQIARETAIQALPVAAQLAAAQGNLEMANQNLDTLFKIKSADAKSNFDFKVGLINAVSQFATKQEDKKLQYVLGLEDRAYKEKQTLNSQAQDWAKVAMSTGQSGLASKLMTLDGGSPTYKQDLQKYLSQIVTTTMKTPEAPTIKTINGVDMEWDGTKWVVPNGGGTIGSDKVQQAKDQLSFLRDTAKQASDLSGAAGPSWIGRTLGDTFVGDTNFRQLEALTNTLKTNMLTLATDPSIKKFFGPQMSNADVLLMTSAGTTINPQANSPATMKAEIQRLDNLFNRMQTAVTNGGVGGVGNTITAPTGEQIIITD